jgi:predicted O-methyltransferase YrrM
LFEEEISRIPAALTAIEAETTRLGFTMPSDRPTGSLLRTLAASKPGGRLLELGTGTGLGTAWLLDGMDAAATLLSVDIEEDNAAVARRHLGDDSRLTIHLGDGAAFIASLRGQLFDLIFADTWPGKYDHLDETLALLSPGGLYVIDDMLPQPNWPAGHEERVADLIEALETRPDLQIVKLHWSSGIFIACKV